MSMNLSKSEQNVLKWAAEKDAHDNLTSYSPYCAWLGWFMPQRQTGGGIHIRHQTCKSLCRKGLLRARSVKYIKRDGLWQAVYEYCINNNGREYIKGLEDLA